eukprot:10357076-Ditylum_brightwellii.AAC.1
MEIPIEENPLVKETPIEDHPQLQQNYTANRHQHIMESDVKPNKKPIIQPALQPKMPQDDKPAK